MFNLVIQQLVDCTELSAKIQKVQGKFYEIKVHLFKEEMRGHTIYVHKFDERTSLEESLNLDLKPLVEKLQNETNAIVKEDEYYKELYYDSLYSAKKAIPIVESFLMAVKMRG